MITTPDAKSRAPPPPAASSPAQTTGTPMPIVSMPLPMRMPRPLPKPMPMPLPMPMPRSSSINEVAVRSVDENDHRTSNTHMRPLAPDPATTRSKPRTSTKRKHRQEHELEDSMQDKLAAERKRHALQQERSVRRKQQAIESMRDQVEELQKLYDNLCLRAAETRKLRRKRDPAATSSCMAATTRRFELLTHRDQEENSANSPTNTRNNAIVLSVSDVRECLGSSRAQSLSSIASEVYRLRRENRFLRELVENNDQMDEMIQLMANQNSRVKRNTMTCWRCSEFLGTNFFYNPFTMEECVAMIHHDYQQHIVDGPDFVDERVNPKMMLGWRGFVHTDESSVRFQLSKRRAAPMYIDLAHIWQHYWKSVISIPARVYSHPVRVQVLQRVSNDIVIARRITTFANGRQLNATILMYCMQVGDLYIVGCIPLPPWGNGSTTFDGNPFCQSLGHSFHTTFAPDTLAYVPGCVTLSPSSMMAGSSSTRPGGVQRPMTHIRMCTWGVWPSYTLEEAQILGKELMNVCMCFEKLIVFEADRKLIE